MRIKTMFTMIALLGMSLSAIAADTAKFGTVEATDGFSGNALNLTNFPSNVVQTNQPQYTTTVAKASTAWQNPSSAANWTWTKTETEVTLTGYTGPNAVVIPDVLDNLPVTTIGTVFQGNTNITSVSGGSNIRVLQTGTFYGCSALTSVAIRYITYAGEENFSSCPLLTAVYIDANAPPEGILVYEGSVTTYVDNPTATGWGATWNGRPVVRLPVSADTFYGNAAGLTNFPANVVQTNDPKYVYVLTNETDTLATVLARGNNAAGFNITNAGSIQATKGLHIGDTSFSSIDPLSLTVVNGSIAEHNGKPGLTITNSVASRASIGSMSRTTLLISNSPASSISGTFTAGSNFTTNQTEIIGSAACQINGRIVTSTDNENGFRGAAIRDAYGSDIEGYIYASSPIVIDSAHGASIRGYFNASSVTNKGTGSIILGALSSQSALITVDGVASVLLGAGTISNKNSIVAGDNQESHGNGSITAGGGFYGNGAGLTGITASNITGVALTTSNTFTGIQKLSSNAIAWDDMLSSASAAFNSGVTDISNNDTLGGRAYATTSTTNAANDHLTFTFQTPHRRKLGSEMHPHLHFYQTNADQTNCWFMYYAIVPLGSNNVSEIFSGPATNQFTYTSGTMHQYAEFPSIGGSEANISSIIRIKLHRRGTSGTGSITVTDFDLHYQVDGFGSDTELNKSY